jgi:hypothetical protein
MATDAGAGPDVTAFEPIGVPNVPYPPYNQLDAQIAGLRAQLMVAEEQLRRTEGMLRRADENLGRRRSGGGADDDEERRRLDGELSVRLRRWDSPPR